MSRFLLTPLLFSTVLVAGCVAQPPVAVAPETTSSLDDRVRTLEQTAARLHQDHGRLGREMAQLEADIARLLEEARERDAQQAPMQLHPVPMPTSSVEGGAARWSAPTPEQARSSGRRLPPARPSAPRSSVPRPSKAEGLQRGPSAGVSRSALASAPAASVSALRPDDLAIEPQEGSAAREGGAAKAVYLVHIASYLKGAELAPGWRVLSHQGGKAMEGATPYATTFTDEKGRAWQRLSVGPFATRAEANQRCNALKASRVWCDILHAEQAALSPVPSR